MGSYHFQVLLPGRRASSVFTHVLSEGYLTVKVQGTDERTKCKLNQVDGEVCNTDTYRHGGETTAATAFYRSGVVV